MQRDIPERDWKVFKELRAIALERFCHRVLNEAGRLLVDSARSSHERYGDVFQLMMERDRELARAFNASRRSRAVFQLALIVKLDLLEPEELARFTPGVRDSVMALTTGMQPPRWETRK